MSKIKLFTDSTCDLPQQLLEKNDVSVLPLYVNFEDQIYRDGVDITGNQLIEKVKKSEHFPSTSAVSPADYYQTFKDYIEEGQEIIYIGLSSKISSSLQNAILTAARFPEGKVNVIDSLNLSTGVGLLVLKAVDYIKSGLKTAEIVAKIEKIIPKVKTEFVVEDLEFIHRGGRCSGLQKFLSSMLRIRPILEVKTGEVVPAEKVRGKKKRVLKRMLQRVLTNKEIIDPGQIFIPQAAAEKEAQFLKEGIKEAGFNKVTITEAGSVISTHCGPGTVGIVYNEKVSD